MANVQEQMLQLLENEELPYADDASASIARTRRIPKSKKFFPQESRNLLEAYKPEIKQQRLSDTLDKNIDTSKKISTGLITGTAALPSEAVDVSNMVNDFMAKYGNNPTAMVMKQLFNNAQKDMGREAFDKWFLKTTGIKSDLTNVDQLVGEFLSPTGTILAALKAIKPIGKVGKYLYDEAKTLFTNASGGDGGSLVSANNAPIKATDETSKLLDKTKTTKPIETSAPIIPESEFVNAKPTINPLFAGEGTETGRKQGAKFRELEAQNKYNAEELFLQTRVYRGEDGQLRWEISTADAKLNSSWEKSLNFKKEDSAFKDEFLGITVPEKNDGFYDGRASMQLSQILEFPTAYKEYYNVKGVTKYFDDIVTNERKVQSETQFNPLRNLKVYWDRGDKYDNTLGFYKPSTDQITLNVRQLKAAARQSAEDYGISFEEAFKLQVESTLLHEVQHAVQIREGFRVGGDSDNFLPKNFDAIVDTNKDNKYNILTNAKDQVDEIVMELAKEDYSYYGNNTRNKILREVEDDFNTLYDVTVHKRTGSIDRYTKDKFQKGKTIQELDSLFIEAQKRLEKRFVDLGLENLYTIEKKLFENAKENIKLINIDNAAINKYYNLYGEREARLVQKRIEDRFKLNKFGGADVAKEVESDTKFLSPEGDLDLRDRKLGKIGGFSPDTKITPTKLMSDGTTFQNKRNQGGLQLAKGGTTMNMNNQMEMFQDGGLKDEGGSIDPVSGNDVPSGSTQEEVRDDIPAQLSEGEFVFPADVTRFIGLEKLMQIRDEAKAGLQRMEDMGQMGNSDEATIPDGVPFSMDDLDMEDDDDGTVEMAQGGVINAATGTFVDNTSNITSTPSQFAGQNLPSQQNNPNAQPVSYTPPTYNNVQDGGFSPTYFNQLTPASDNVSTFTDLVGNNYGQYDEMRKYRSESGMVLSIPFKAGQPIYPIPEGYTYIDPEEVVEKAPVVQSVAPTTTRVVEQGDGEPGDGGGGAVDLVGDPLSYSGIFSQDALDKTLRGYAGMQLNLGDMKGALERGFNNQVNVNEITLNAARETLKGIKSTMTNPNVNLGTLTKDARNQLNEQLERMNNNISTLVTNKNYDSNGKISSSTPVTIETLETRAKGLETQARIAGFNMLSLNKTNPIINRPSVNVRNPMAMRNYAKSVALRAATIQIALQQETQNKIDTFKSEADKASTFDTMATLQEAQNEAIETTPYGVPDISPTDSNDSGDNPGMGGGDSGDTSGYTDDTGMGVGAKGGFFTKSKMTKQKPKKMKQGGLASRK